MKGPEQGRVLWLGAALLATLLAAQWVSGGEGRTAEAAIAEAGAAIPEERTSRKETPTAAGAADETAPLELELARLERRKFSPQAGDIFGRKTWIAPPVPEMKPARPSPPPLQFKYLGRLTDGEVTQVFLALSDRNYVVKPGETINDQYRVDEVNDNSVTFTYLPLNAKQTLSTTGAGV